MLGLLCFTDLYPFSGDELCVFFQREASECPNPLKSQWKTSLHMVMFSRPAIKKVNG